MTTVKAYFDLLKEYTGGLLKSGYVGVHKGRRIFFGASDKDTVELVHTESSEITGKVSKTGDTMTGDLIIEAGLHVNSNTDEIKIGTGSTSSSNPFFTNVGVQNFNPTGGGSSSGHGFVDGINFKGFAYAAFDAKSIYKGNTSYGNADYDHYVGFQARPQFNFAQGMGRYAGHDSKITSLTSGLTITDAAHFEMREGNYNSTTIDTEYVLRGDAMHGTVKWGFHFPDAGNNSYTAGKIWLGTTAGDQDLTVAGGQISGGTNWSTATSRVLLDLAGASGSNVAILNYNNGGEARVYEISLNGTDDILFQGVPNTTAGFTTLEGFNSAGLILRTRGNANPVYMKVNDVLKLSVTSTSVDAKADITSTGMIQASGFFNVGAGVSATIVAGAITATSSLMLVNTEASASTDDLDTINGGTNGDILILKAANGTRTVVVKDVAVGGNIQLTADMSLDSDKDTLTLLYTGSVWIEIARANNA